MSSYFYVRATTRKADKEEAKSQQKKSEDDVTRNLCMSDVRSAETKEVVVLQ